MRNSAKRNILLTNELVFKYNSIELYVDIYLVLFFLINSIFS